MITITRNYLAISVIYSSVYVSHSIEFEKECLLIYKFSHNSFG